MEPVDYLGALRRSWRLVVALGLIGVLIAVLVPIGAGHKKGHVKRLPNPWEASATVGAAPTGNNTVIGGGATGSQIQFYAISTAVERAALNAAGLRSVKTANMGAYLKATLLVPAGVGKREAENANLVRLTGAGPTARRAKKLTNAYAKEVGTYLNRIAAGRARSGAVVVRRGVGSGYVIVHPALTATKRTVKRPSAGPVKSRKVRALIGLGVGVVLAAGIVLMRELLSKRLRTAARAEATFGYPVIVEIPTTLSAIGRRSLSVDVVNDPVSPAAEAYRMLRMAVLFEALASGVVPTDDFGQFLIDPGAHQEAPGAPGGGAGGGGASAGEGEPEPLALPTPVSRRVLMVVSPSTESTRPQVAANLAAAYAEAGQRVVVLGTGELGAGPPRGSGRTLSGEITSEDVEARLEASWVDRVFRLDLRHFIENSGQLVLRMPAVLHATRAVSDVVIIEAPPLLAVHHVEALSQLVDVVLVVGEAGTTTFTEARRSGDLLRRMAAPVLGVVLTNVRLQYRDPRQLTPESQLELTSGAGLGREPVGADAGSSGAPAHSPA
jgi:Mrp family chromosome partitioning ATPase